MTSMEQRGACEAFISNEMMRCPGGVLGINTREVIHWRFMLDSLPNPEWCGACDAQPQGMAEAMVQARSAIDTDAILSRVYACCMALGMEH